MRAAALSALALTTLMLIPAASQAQPLLQELPNDELVSLLEGLQFEDVAVQNEDVDGVSIRVETGGYFFFIENYENGYVRIVAWFQNVSGLQRTTLTLANDWNKQHGFTKAYINSAGEFVLEADFSLDQDVTEAGIEERVLQFVEHLNAFGEFTAS